MIEIEKTHEKHKKKKSPFEYTYHLKKKKKNNQLIPIKYRNQYITYLYNAKKYEKLLEYKEFLNLDMLKVLGNNGYKVEVTEVIRKKYPLEIEYADLEKIEYFYFNHFIPQSGAEIYSLFKQSFAQSAKISVIGFMSLLVSCYGSLF